MKVYELLTVMDKCDFVEIHAVDSLEWGDDNPYTYQAQKVAELPWVLVNQIAKREIVSVGMYERIGDGGVYLSIRYE